MRVLFHGTNNKKNAEAIVRELHLRKGSCLTFIIEEASRWSGIDGAILKIELTDEAFSLLSKQISCRSTNDHQYRVDLVCGANITTAQIISGNELVVVRERLNEIENEHNKELTLKRLNHQECKKKLGERVEKIIKNQT